MIYKNINSNRKYEIVEENGGKVLLRDIDSGAEITISKITFSHYLKPAFSSYACPNCGYALKGLPNKETMLSKFDILLISGGLTDADYKELVTEINKTED